MIKSIHITRDAFAAENHSAGGLFIDIITQPGARAAARRRERTTCATARSAAAARSREVKGPERSQKYGTNFARHAGQETSLVHPVAERLDLVRHAEPATCRAGRRHAFARRCLAQPPRNDNVFVSGLFDYAITKDQTLRVNYNQNDFTQQNLGVGGYDRPERAYNSENTGTFIRIQEVGPLGRRALHQHAAADRAGRDSSSTSLVEAVTFRVNERFTSGGAQVTGGAERDTLQPAVGSRLRARHPFRPHGRRCSTAARITRTTPQTISAPTLREPGRFDGGHAAELHRRIGDPNIDYLNLRRRLYVQDDIRVRKSLTLTPGLRYEAQTHLDDYNAFGPRVGVTWAPFKNGKTTLRGSAGRVLRLAQCEHLRADAPGRRGSPAGAEHREPSVSRSWQRRRRDRRPTSTC